MTKNPATEAISNMLGHSVVARAFDQSRQSIMSWEEKGVPAKYMRAVSEASGVSIERLLEHSEQYQGIDYKTLLRSIQSEVKRAAKGMAAL